MTFKWKNKDEELPMSIERADYNNTFQLGTFVFGIGIGMVSVVVLLAILSAFLPPL